MMVGDTVRQVRELLWHGADPFAGLPERLFEADAQGWRSQHPYLSSGIEFIRPRIIVEVGVWKGGSTLYMANKLRELGLDAVVIAVDTWLGAWDHWTDSNWFQELNFSYGYPQLFYKFAANVVVNKLQDYVVPLPLDSVNAREVVSRRGIVVDMLHIDAAHDYTAVSSDLAQWWQVLRPGGLFIGDDYVPGGMVWPEVKRAIDDFLAGHRYTGFQESAGKCAALKA